jgi:hypothetical protein
VRPIRCVDVGILAVIRIPWAQVHGFTRGSGGMAAPDNIHMCQRHARGFACFRCNACVDTDGLSRLIAVLVATTVATGLPDSGEREHTHVCHDDYSYLSIKLMRMVACFGVSRPRVFADYFTSVSSAQASSA